MAKLVGTSIKYRVEFTDEDGAAYDPDAVSFVLKAPDGTETEWEAGESSIVREELGIFHIWVTPAAELAADEVVVGEWTGTFTGADVDGRTAIGCAIQEMTNDCEDVT